MRFRGGGSEIVMYRSRIWGDEVEDNLDKTMMKEGDALVMF